MIEAGAGLQRGATPLCMLNSEYYEELVEITYHAGLTFSTFSSMMMVLRRIRGVLEVSVRIIIITNMHIIR